jgi:hypothetical protein
MEFMMVAIFCSASLSLVSYMYCWQDIRAGRPHILSLRQITGIMDRHCLTRLLGTPRPGYYFELSPMQRAVILRSRRLFYLRECAADLTCLAGVWLYMTGRLAPDYAPLFVALATACQLVNLLYSFCLISKWGVQLREEIENSED